MHDLGRIIIKMVLQEAQGRAHILFKKNCAKNYMSKNPDYLPKFKEKCTVFSSLF